MSSSSSPCAACKLRRQKCTQECVFAPYFPPDQPQKFSNVHNVFGASNVAKILNELDASQREDAVNSLAYEAEARLRDPVYGCVGLISILQHRLKQVQSDLEQAKKELAALIGPQAMLPILQPSAFMPQQHLGNASSSAVMKHKMMPKMEIPTGPVLPPAQQHPQQIFDAQQLAAVLAAREQQEMLRGYEHQQQQPEVLRFNSGGFEGTSSVAANGFNQISNSGGGMSSSLGLGMFDSPYGQIQQQQEQHHHAHSPRLEAQIFLQSEQTQPQQQKPQQRSGSEEGKSVGPSC
ncbi:hypothetical protein SLA2020_385890 [Shorea laevis]